MSLGLLSASVAHELNTPLAVLNGSIEKLIETTRDAHDARTGWRRMQRVRSACGGSARAWSDFARVRKQQMEPLAVRPLIDEAWALVAIDEKSSSVEFVNEVRAEDQVIGNSDRLVQVFVNLLRNALNAMEAQQRPDRGALAASGSRGRGGDRDHGGGQRRGIPADVLPDIFDAFVTTRLDARGTGLGLTVAEGIVTQHGGTISASNRAEGGACLEVWLPAARTAG